MAVNVLETKLGIVTSNHAKVQKTVNGDHGINVVLHVDWGNVIEKLKNQPYLVGRSVLGLRLRSVTSNNAIEAVPLPVNGGNGVHVV